MKRTSQSILVALLAAVAVFAQSASARGNEISAPQAKKKALQPENKKKQNAGAACSPHSGMRPGMHSSVRFGLRPGMRYGSTDDPCFNGYNGFHGVRGRGPAGRLMRGVACGAHSGQPLIDPWARADWIAAQRAARSSWHAGYYHTAWGVPVALMVSPHVRMHTRLSWGVNQSTMHPLYHQYERPYPGPAATGGVVEPLRPTPRWPSHTDQFGVYYVRGPW